LVPPIVDSLKDRGLNVMVVLGGIIPESDRLELKNNGVSEIFGPGSNTQDIASFIKEEISKK